MTTIIRTENSQEAYATKFIPVVSTGLVAWDYLFDNANKATRNLLDFTSLGSAVGSPTIDKNGATFDGMNGKYIQTTIAEKKDFTVLAVITSNDTLDSATTRPYFLTTLGGTAISNPARSSVGSSLFAGGSNTINFSSARYNNTTSTANSAIKSVAINYAKWNFVVGRAGDTYAHLWNLTDNVNSGSPELANLPRDLSTGKYKLGKRTTTNLSAEGKSNLAFFAIYDRILSDAEVQKIYEQVQFYLSDVRNINI